MFPASVVVDAALIKWKSFYVLMDSFYIFVKINKFLRIIRLSKFHFPVFNTEDRYIDVHTVVTKLDHLNYENNIVFSCETKPLISPLVDGPAHDIVHDGVGGQLPEVGRVAAGAAVDGRR